MNVRYSLRGLHFEWDPSKAQSNLKKHRVSFESACEVFFDPFLLLKDAGDADAATQAAIGETAEERLLFVVHLIQREEVIRIISARPVTPHERREYED